MAERDTTETADGTRGREPPAEGASAVPTRTLFRLGLAIVALGGWRYRRPPA